MKATVRHHIFLSPHLDDVVLSCGGTVAHLCRAGVPVTILSIFTGKIDSSVPLSPFAALLHPLWCKPAQAYATRRAEDVAALVQFGLKPHWLNWLDCIYRGDAAPGTWYYPDDDALFGAVHPAEENLPQQLARAIKTYLRQHNLTDAPAVFYVPLAVGNHVDHQLTHRAAAMLIRADDAVFFYEDYPYIRRQPADLARAHRASDAIWGDGKWTARPQTLTDDDLRAKLDAIAAYGSQMNILFGGEAAMRQDVRTFFRPKNVPVEKFWQKVND